MEKQPGILVAFEGIDGSGKTTQASRLQDWAEGLGFEVVNTKEPTNGTWGAKIRASKFTARMPPMEELEHFIRDRQEHVAIKIRPALERGALVIVDRYYYSTVAYQGARGLQPRDVLAANRAFAPVPDSVFLLDLAPDIGLSRIEKRGSGIDLFETLDELQKARAIFNSLNDSHIIRIDATQSIEAVSRQVINNLVAGPMFKRMVALSETYPKATAPMPAEQYKFFLYAQKLAEDPAIPLETKLRLIHEEAAAVVAPKRRRS